jgi:hypothetical protein
MLLKNLWKSESGHDFILDEIDFIPTVCLYQNDKITNMYVGFENIKMYVILK